MRVMVVDDNEIGAELMATYAADCGHQVVACVSNVDDAWRAVQAMTIDLTIADVDLGSRPGFDGIGLATLMREEFGIRTIFVTGQSGPTVRNRAQGAWPLGFMVKPVNPETFRSMVKIAEDMLEVGGRLTRYRTPSTLLDSAFTGMVSHAV